ncbi:iron-sulfur protein [Streptomyces sp. DH-12]|uniref:Rieske (2Fe-2S) protein n=1 Tax=Streptomyces sp. DH-12 TaxID=2072509 RepID=UPI000CCF471E|nr:Rieske (2Fe-2S) protein [Streptomyces sp. DH-12]PNV35301.1 iron-sulfur protein [Streptomyces sp. DH-12]
MTTRATRRTVLLASGAVALAAGCGSGDGGGGESPDAEGSAGQELLPAADVPVGGGRILGAEKIVVTQPEQGVFKAFSAVCTHQNCLVSDVSDGTVNCVCHNSRFSITDGSVEQGPATEPLPEERITVDGNTIRRA